MLISLFSFFSFAVCQEPRNQTQWWRCNERNEKDEITHTRANHTLAIFYVA